MSSQANICGRCSKSYDSVAEYEQHTCEITGFKPSQPEHMGPVFAEVQKAALARGAARQAG